MRFVEWPSTAVADSDSLHICVLGEDPFGEALDATLAGGDIAGKSITTIEGLSGTVARAVIEGWVKAQAPQCGYCQPGFVMAATSVIAADPKQPREAVLAQLTNICRCGTYDAIRAAVGYALEALDRALVSQKQGSAP